MHKKSHNNAQLLLAIMAIVTSVLAIISYGSLIKQTNYKDNKTNETFNVLVAEDNRDIVYLIDEYMTLNYPDTTLNIDYDTTIGVIDRLNQDNAYDMVWLSNSIWMYMLDGTSTVNNQKSTYITPIVYGVKESKAKELGFMNKDVYMRDILDAINNDELSFIMSSCTQTNTGASAYLGIISTLSGNPNVLKNEDIQKPELLESLKETFSKINRASGDDKYTIEQFETKDLDCIVTYEYELIQMNQRRQELGLEPIYAIYPVDGVSFSDAPIAYVDRKDEKKFEVYTELKNYITSTECISKLYNTGRRAGYGWEIDSNYKKVFNSNWGIINNKFISTIKYPSDKIIKKSFSLYQTALKKPSITVFCLDYSGSMMGQGVEELRDAFDKLMDDDFANKNFIDFGDSDYIGYVAFSSDIRGSELVASNKKESLIESLNSLEPNGGTDIYIGMNTSEIMIMDKLKELGADESDYNLAIVLMTDGQSSDANLDSWKSAREGLSIPVFSITFGDASTWQLDQVSEFTSGQTFDGKKNLIKAFKTVRGYN